MSQPSQVASEPMRITWEMLRDAIATYLGCAYPSGVIPPAVQKRIALNEQGPLVDALGAPPFEKYLAHAPFQCTVYALRLGSADYPNLKMEIRPFPHRLGFVFWVNTHDDFVAPDAQVRESAEWRNLMRRNRDLKQMVERAWAERKLPTFASAMSDDSTDTPTQAT